MQPIEIKSDGIILDGHHRYKIAKELGIEQVDCRIVNVDIDEEIYLISVSLLRRHLSDDQRAVLALKYAEILSKARQKEAAKKANEDRWYNNKLSDSHTVCESEESNIKDINDTKNDNTPILEDTTFTKIDEKQITEGNINDIKDTQENQENNINDTNDNKNDNIPISEETPTNKTEEETITKKDNYNENESEDEDNIKWKNNESLSDTV